MSSYQGEGDPGDAFKSDDPFKSAGGPASAGVHPLEEKHPDIGTAELAGDSAIGEGNLHRGLKNRHIAMISIGGVIGTGLFLGTANALEHGGPVGLVLGYAIMGTIVYSVMVSLGEMIAYLPISGGHVKLAERFVDNALSFAMGWNYWYNWVVVLPAELSAAAVLVNFWDSTTNNAAWISIFIVVVSGINLLGAKGYGEAEFWFASIKVITIIGLIILGIVLDLGGGPSHDRLGFRYWKNPGPFVQYLGIEGAKGRFLGFWAVLIQAGFSYIGTEIVAIASGESRNPRRNIPRAIRRVYVRILIFYIGGTFIISLLVPSNEPNLGLKTSTGAKSPFVIALKNAGVKGLPSVVNAAFLTSACSAASSDLYTSSRALYALSISGQAPRIFSKTLKNGLPWVSLTVSIAFTFLSFMGVSAGSNMVFNWFANMTSLAGLLTWVGICITYLRFYKGMKVQGYDRKKLPFANWGQPYLAWYGMISCCIIVLFNGFAVFIHGNWDVATFVTSYLPMVLFPLLYFGSKLWQKSRVIAPEEMSWTLILFFHPHPSNCAADAAVPQDFVSGIDEIEAAETPEKPPKNFVDKIWKALM